jgi:hypothetical protein
MGCCAHLAAQPGARATTKRDYPSHVHTGMTQVIPAGQSSIVSHTAKQRRIVCSASVNRHPTPAASPSTSSGHSADGTPSALHVGAHILLLPLVTQTAVGSLQSALAVHAPYGSTGPSVSIGSGPVLLEPVVGTIVVATLVLASIVDPSSSTHSPANPSPASSPYRRMLGHATSAKLQNPVASHVPCLLPSTHCSFPSHANAPGAHADIAPNTAATMAATIAGPDKTATG